MNLWIYDQEKDEREEITVDTLLATPRKYTRDLILAWAYQNIYQVSELNRAYFDRLYNLTVDWVDKKMSDEVRRNLRDVMMDQVKEVTGNNYPLAHDTAAVITARVLNWLQIALQEIKEAGLLEDWKNEVKSIADGFSHFNDRLEQVEQMLKDLRKELDEVKSQEKLEAFQSTWDEFQQRL